MKDYINKNTYFLLRHGESEHNVEEFLSDAEHDKKSPSHITDKGMRDIQEAAKELVTDKIDIIYASPLTRTMETASFISKELGLEIIKDNRLRELEFGVLSGGNFSDFHNFYKDKDRMNDAPEGAESLMDVRARAQDFIDEIHHIYNRKNILIVSHGDVVWMLEAILDGYEREEVFDMAYIEPGELRVLGT